MNPGDVDQLARGITDLASGGFAADEATRARLVGEFFTGWGSRGLKVGPDTLSASKTAADITLGEPAVINGVTYDAGTHFSDSVYDFHRSIRTLSLPNSETTITEQLHQVHGTPDLFERTFSHRPEVALWDRPGQTGQTFLGHFSANRGLTYAFLSDSGRTAIRFPEVSRWLTPNSDLREVLKLRAGFTGIPSITDVANQTVLAASRR